VYKNKKTRLRTPIPLAKIISEEGLESKFFTEYGIRTN
jgi:hypothetical protein